MKTGRWVWEIVHRTVAAKDVSVGDKIYDRGYFYFPDRWVEVRNIENISGRLTFDVGHCKIGAREPEEGVAVKKRVSLEEDGPLEGTHA